MLYYINNFYCLRGMMIEGNLRICEVLRQDFEQVMKKSGLLSGTTRSCF